ncbi:flagellin [Bacillaceae bacterium W0354]
MKRTNVLSNLKAIKLNSGKRINMAADDAAGLAISQKMRAQIRGLSQASRNVQDASSMLQVAEGGMGEITQLVQRMRELSVKASNDTLTYEDRLHIQEEIDQMKKGIADIVYNTEFNTHKVLSNLEYGDFIIEPRQTNNLIFMGIETKNNLVKAEVNRQNETSMDYNPVKIEYEPVYSTERSEISSNHSVKASTVVDYKPRYSKNGEYIVFKSSRDNQTYMTLSEGGNVPEVNTNNQVIGQQVVSSNGLAKLQMNNNNNTLQLYFRDRTTNNWNYHSTIYDYNYSQDGDEGFSFSPVTDENGNTSFVYSDTNFNIKQVKINTNNKKVLSTNQIIHKNDRLNLPANNQTINLTYAPKIYRMNEVNASLKIEKITDLGAKELTYWDGKGTPPPNGYYTVNGSQVTFFGDAIIGQETHDNAQDYYRFSFVSGIGDKDIYQYRIPYDAEVYNMDGSEGPRSLDIYVGGRQVTKMDLLSTRPLNHDESGVYVNQSTGYIEFFGDWRPAHNERVNVKYLEDNYTNDGVYTKKIPSGIDLYNLTDSNNTSNRSLRVYVAGEEIFYDKDNGFTYDRETGLLKVHGDARPDKPSNERVEVRYFEDKSGSNTDEKTVGIPLYNRYPELYNLESGLEPSSIKVIRNGIEEIAFSNTDGYQYNKDTNTIELYGTARPDVDDTYTIKFVQDSPNVQEQNGIVEIQLEHVPELYVDEQTNEPLTLEVMVDNVRIQFDESKQNGYFYNREKNTIALYGNARPGVDNHVSINYVLETSTQTHDNNSYDIQLTSSPANYGVSNQGDPRSMSVYYKGNLVPYSEENGFTYDSSNNTVSLHGDYRPTVGDDIGDLQIYWIKSSMLEQTIPESHSVFEVKLNGQVVPPADENNGDGYIVENGKVTLAGSSRPMIDRDTRNIQLEVAHHQSTVTKLNTNSLILDPSTGEYQETPILNSDIDPKSIQVRLNGNIVDEELYQLVNDQITFSDELLLSRGTNRITVDYDLLHAKGYKSNEYIYQIGANQNQQITVEIRSFENLLKKTSPYSVITRESANRSIALADELIEFVTTEQTKIGAVQNRLESIASTLSTAEESVVSANSRIEDADIAKEVMEHTKLSILKQVQQSIQVHYYNNYESILSLLK